MTLQHENCGHVLGGGDQVAVRRAMELKAKVLDGLGRFKTGLVEIKPEAEIFEVTKDEVAEVEGLDTRACKEHEVIDIIRHTDAGLPPLHDQGASNLREQSGGNGQAYKEDVKWTETRRVSQTTSTSCF